MSAALQNSDNWPGIMQAARELKGKLPELEGEVGIRATIGPIEEATHEEVERLLGGGLPRTVEPENTVMHDFREPPRDIWKERQVMQPRVIDTTPLSDRQAMDRILADANDAPKAKKEGTLRWLGRGLLKKFGFLALLAGTPIPQMQLQHCAIAREGPLATITCDSTDVCPPGYVLETVFDGGWPDRGEDMMKVLGYGSGVENNCIRPQGFGRKVNQLIP